MSTAQVFQESLKTAIFGMGLVLSTLFTLSLILDLMRIVFSPKQVKKNEQPIKEQSQTNYKTTDPAADTKLIAIITAAINEYIGASTAVKVNSIRQIHTKTPIWGMVSRINQGQNKL